VSSFLTAHQRLMIGYLVPFNGVEDLIQRGYNQDCLTTIKYE